jgi:GntR family transcriptional repressor for pyruvate dehydrogenase complex
MLHQMAGDGDLQRTPRSTLISDSLLERINTGEFLPGKKLPSEQQLQHQYGVSRPVVREAVKSLVAQGLVVVESGRGAVVQEVNDKMLRTFFRRALTADMKSRVNLMQLRAVLERYSASRAALYRSDEQLERIECALKRMREARGDFDNYSRHDVDFHIELAEAADNAFVSNLISSIRNSLLLIIDQMRHHLTPHHFQHVQSLHEHIYEAVADGDADRAVVAMGNHFDDVLGRIRNDQEEPEEDTQ